VGAIDTVVGVANNASATARVVARRYPGETIEYVAGATFIRTRDPHLMGSDWRRLFRQRRGNLVITSNRVVFSTRTVSLMTAFWVTYVALFAVAAALTQLLWLLVPAILPLPYLVQRLPYSVDAPFDEITASCVETVSGIAAPCTAIVLGHRGQFLQLVMNKPVDASVRRLLGVGSADSSEGGPTRASNRLAAKRPVESGREPRSAARS
jgi:hypothetical protein